MTRRLPRLHHVLAFCAFYVTSSIREAVISAEITLPEGTSRAQIAVFADDEGTYERICAEHYGGSESTWFDSKTGQRCRAYYWSEDGTSWAVHAPHDRGGQSVR